MNVDTLVRHHAKLSRVNDYVQLRWQSQAPEVPAQLSPTGCLVDAEGQRHVGARQLLEYFQQPVPSATVTKEPIILADHRALVEFSVVKYLMTWHLKADFEFADTHVTDPLLFQRIMIEWPGLFC